MKKKTAIFLTLLSLIFLVLFNLPLEITNRAEINRGNDLLKHIEKHIKETAKIPTSDDWETFRVMGFSEIEMERAYPFIQKINDSTFELIFIRGFDPPYLMWNSEERVWKKDFPTIPEDYVH